MKHYAIVGRTIKEEGNNIEGVAFIVNDKNYIEINENKRGADCCYEALIKLSDALKSKRKEAVVIVPSKTRFEAIKSGLYRELKEQKIYVFDIKDVNEKGKELTKDAWELLNEEYPKKDSILVSLGELKSRK